MITLLTSWWRKRRWAARRRDFAALFEALDLCRCTGHRQYVEHLALRYGMGPFDAAVEAITNVGNLIQSQNIKGPVVVTAPVPEPVRPIDLANMTIEDEARVFYALLANRYDRRLADLTALLNARGIAQAEQLADQAITRWCTPIEEDLEAEDVLALIDAKGISHGNS